MDTFTQLSQQRSRIVEAIAGLGPMRPGTVYDHAVPTRRRDGSVYRRGPYPTYSCKQGRVTRAKQLKGAQEEALYRRQIEAFRRYQDLSKQLVQVSQRLADLEAAAGEDGDKKNSRR